MPLLWVSERTPNPPPEPMSEDEIISLALEHWPDAMLGEDNDGQIIIYTGVFQNDPES